MSDEIGNLTIENAQVLFANFEGREGAFNREGDRNFCIKLDEDLAVRMAQDGWNVKRLKPREETPDGEPYIQVSVGFKYRHPRMVLITSQGRVTLTEEDQCPVIDHLDVKNWDVIVRPYRWDVNGKTGIKAYLKSIFITLEEDELDLKYADVPEALPGKASPLAIEASDPNVIDAEVVEDGDTPPWDN